MPISEMRRQAEILSRCAEASYWMATRSGEDDRAVRIRKAASLIEEVALAMRASDRSRAPAVQVPAQVPARVPAQPLAQTSAQRSANVHPLRRPARG